MCFKDLSYKKKLKIRHKAYFFYICSTAILSILLYSIPTVLGKEAALNLNFTVYFIAN